MGRVLLRIGVGIPENAGLECLWPATASAGLSSWGINSPPAGLPGWPNLRSRKPQRTQWEKKKDLANLDNRGNVEEKPLKCM